MFAPIRVVPARPRRAGRAGDRMSELTRAVEALLFIASEPRQRGASWPSCADAPPERVERALDALGDRYCEERSGVVLERVAGGYGFRAAADDGRGLRSAGRPAAVARAQPGGARDAGHRRLPGAGVAARDRPHPRRRLRLGGRRAARPRPDRGGRPGRHARGSRSSTRPPSASGARSASRSDESLPALAEFELHRGRSPGAARPPAPGRRPACRSGLTGCWPGPGVASRRAVEDLIAAGRVTVNGRVAAVGHPGRGGRRGARRRRARDRAGGRRTLCCTSRPGSSRRPATPAAGGRCSIWSTSPSGCSRSAGSIATPPAC